jgi:hypothetical protein
MLGRFEYEYEKNREKSGAPKLPPVLSELFESWFPATSVTTVGRGNFCGFGGGRVMKFGRVRLEKGEQSEYSSVSDDYDPL